MIFGPELWYLREADDKCNSFYFCDKGISELASWESEGALPSLLRLLLTLSEIWSSTSILST